VVYHLPVYEPGTVVAGKYRIERQLGTGGMGVVVAATHMQLGTPVALKFLHQDLLQNPSVAERFMREARSSAKLRGEHVCRVSDVGTTDEGQPFIVMELLDGQDLGTVLRASGALTLSSAAEAIMQACIALGEAHALGFVHRDIKPGNLFWTQRPDGTALIKVLDFGVVKGPEEINFSLTQTSNVIGSPGYMSPEQLKSSKTVDARSDIWSLGVVLYELVSGRKPFHGESITELASRVAMDPVPPLSGGIPASFESVILRCLEKEPARRFKNVADLAQALAPFVGPVRGSELAYAVSRVLKGAHTPMVAATPPHGLPNTPTTLRGANGVVAPSGIRNKRSWRLPAIMAAGAVAGIAIALVTLSQGKSDKPAAANQPVETTKMEVAPVASEPAKPEAAKAEPVKPAKAEPVKTAEPVKAEPVKPAKAESVKTAEPVKAEPAKVEPAKVEPAKIVEKTSDNAVATKPDVKKTTKKSTKKTTKKTTKTTEDVGDSRL